MCIGEFVFTVARENCSVREREISQFASVCVCAGKALKSGSGSCRTKEGCEESEWERRAGKAGQENIHY